MKSENIFSLLLDMRKYLKDPTIKSLLYTSDKDDAGTEVVSFTYKDKTEENKQIEVKLVKARSTIVKDYYYAHYHPVIYINGVNISKGKIWSDTYDLLKKHIGQENLRCLCNIKSIAYNTPNTLDIDWLAELNSKSFYFDDEALKNVDFTTNWLVSIPKDDVKLNETVYYYGIPSEIIEQKWEKYQTGYTSKNGKAHKPGQLSKEDWLKQLLTSWRINTSTTKGKLKKTTKAIQRSKLERERKLYWDNVRVWKTEFKKSDKIPSEQGNKDPENKLVFIYNNNKDLLLRIPKKEANQYVQQSGYKFISKQDGKRIREEKNLGFLIQRNNSGKEQPVSRKLRRYSLQSKSSSKKGASGTGKYFKQKVKARKYDDFVYIKHKKFEPHGKRYSRFKEKEKKLE
jgi:hypothetical protein